MQDVQTTNGWRPSGSASRCSDEHPAIDDVEFYLCGPPPMMVAVRRMLDDLGVAPRQIAFADFGS